MKKILLLDGNSLLYRAFYALPADNFRNSSGQATNAIYGFASMLINLIRDEQPNSIAVAFDISRETFRSKIYSDYKANRAASPDELRSQFSYCREFIDAMQIPKFEREGFEADDVIASLVSELRSQSKENEIVICTSDRDSFQLIQEGVTVLYPMKGVSELKRMDPSAVLDRYGVTPAQYIDYAALRGDPSDNLPSLPGIGEKTAANLITEYGSLTNLLAHAAEVRGKVGETLRNGGDVALRNRELTELRSDLAIGIAPIVQEWDGPDAKAVERVFDTLEIRALRDRVRALTSGGDSTPQSPIQAKLELSGFDREAIMKLIDSSTSIALVAVETGFILTFENGASFELSEDQLRKLPPISVTTHQGKELLRRQLVGAIEFDVELAGYLLSPGSRDLSLPELVRKYLGQSIEDGDQGGAVSHILALSQRQQKLLEESGNLKLFADLELPLLNCLANMERLGIAVDRATIKGLIGRFSEKEQAATKSLFSQVGREFNPASPKQLQEVLFEDLKLPKTKRTKTGFSTDAESLEWLAATTGNPALASLLEIREFSKLRTIVSGLDEAIATDGRIHTTFQQTVAATGRLSSTEPNLQNIPIRTEEGRKIRAVFVAGSGYSELMTADYSQIEMRIMAHLSKDAALIAAFEAGEDLHSSIAGQVFGVSPKDVDAAMRRQVKAMSYGLAYGLSSFGLAQRLDIAPQEASALMAKYFERFGGIQDYLKSVVEEARERGYTETILGRRRYLPDLTHENRQRREVAERMALNSPIQGSAADIIKVAMLRVAAAIENAKLGSRLLLQIHDELIFEIVDGERDAMEELVRREMGSAYPLRAPLDVSVGFGRDWDSAGH